MLTPQTPDPSAATLDELREMLRIPAQLQQRELEPPRIGQLEALKEQLQCERAELLLISIAGAAQSIWSLPMLSRYALSQLDVPVLFFPGPPPQTAPEQELAAADLAWSPNGEIQLYAETPELFGVLARPYTGSLQLLHRDLPARSLTFSNGNAILQLPTNPPPSLLGLCSDEETTQPHAHALSTTVRVLQPEVRPLILYDTDLTDASITGLLEHIGHKASFIGVRLRRTYALSRLRQRLAGLNAPTWLFDAGQILDDGSPTDLPPRTEALRLLRVAQRLQLQGFDVAAIAVKDKQHICPKTLFVWQEKSPFESLSAHLQSLLLTETTDHPHTKPPLLDPLQILTHSQPIEGNQVTLEAENQEARTQLLTRINAAQTRIHIQVYIIHDDDITAQIEHALRAAAARGVRIRILADSLYSMHGSFGLENPWLTRMAAVKGVAVQLYRPIENLPDLENLKQRDHRKFIIIDGRAAIVTGRNLAASYYTGFSEVQISPESPEEALPWLDAGTFVEGPIVANIEASFARSWIAAGGTPFEELPTPRTAGPMTCRLIEHEGLRDTHTLDAQLTLIRTAQSRLRLVNTFPLQQEIIHALRRALQRGVQVQILIGNVRPMYNDHQPFSGNPLRTLASQVVLSRIDQIIAAGGEAYEFALKPLPHWDPSLRQVLPHVHAKLLICDQTLAAIGSANVDITSGFWESEALLLVEDADFTTQLHAQLDLWLEHALPLQPDDPRWQRDAQLRAWLDRVWPSIIA